MLLIMLVEMISSSKCKIRWHKQTLLNSDMRITYISDALKGIRTIKSSCLEEYFLRIIADKRNE